MNRKIPNKRWLANPARRVKRDHLLHVMRATMGDNHAVLSPVGGDRNTAMPVATHNAPPTAPK